MKFDLITLPALRVIGMEGSTDDGEGFIQRLWEAANSRFGEIAHLVRTDANGAPAGVWGAMTDFSRRFLPWEDNFSRGLYLAGAEVTDGAEPPQGWTAWDIPAFEYLRFRADGQPDLFSRALETLKANGYALAGAAQELTIPGEGAEYLLFPIRRL